VVIGTLPAFKMAGANSTAKVCLPVKYRHRNQSVLVNVAVLGKQQIVRSKKQIAKANDLSSIKTAALDSVTKLLRLKLYIDQYNYDDIAIGFNSGASTAYNFNEDSKYLPGIDAPEGLSCFSSDGVPLSIDLLPLPKQTPDVIRLDVEAQNSGPITLKRTELDSLPKIYSIWLVDNYKKDSVDLRVDSNYIFTINKSDTASFGAWRFKVVVRQAAPAPFKLVDFNATKGSAGAEITWGTQNESDDTHFAIERSSDDGSTFGVLDSLVSCSKGSYSYTDNNPPAASDEYRVRVTDASGTISYSNVVTLNYSVSAPAATSAISLYPNPTNGVINLMINKNSNSGNNLSVQSTATFAASSNTGTTSYSIRIVNISGTTIKSAVSSSGSWQDNVSNLSAGTYIITVMDNTSNKLVGRSTFVKM
jgi:hypothetical protein